MPFFVVDGEIVEKKVGQIIECNDLVNVREVTTEKTEAQRRKECPMYLGLLVYFPDALEAVSNVSFVAGKQHHPGEPVHWDRKKSSDEPDALLRHLKDRAKGEQFDTDGARHLAKVAWRALAMLQKEIEADLNPRDAGESL